MGSAQRRRMAEKLLPNDIEDWSYVHHHTNHPKKEAMGATADFLCQWFEEDDLETMEKELQRLQDGVYAALRANVPHQSIKR